MNNQQLIEMLEQRHFIRIWDSKYISDYSVNEIIQILKEKGLRIVFIDGKKNAKSQDLIEFIYSQGDNYVPNCYGHNWDALEEILTDGEPHFDGKTVIILSEYENLLLKSPTYDYKIFIDLLLDLITQNDLYYVIFTRKFGFTK